ncbi:helix-turn-helix domain-containing protein [Cellulomonas sp. Root137]|uniref:helix-turn-helix domain-containing protein n=1 Tax=Cellulomonas sp. Root137 TaxID=1736459 RepID=UPI000A408ADC|nr:helix-turn-helix transcriptional regulator [Cellulomonas sp. Root137]
MNSNFEVGRLCLIRHCQTPAFHALLAGQTFVPYSYDITDVPVDPLTVEPERREAWARSRQQVGSNVRRLRLAAGLTQEALALESGLSRNVLIDLEHGRRGVLFERLFDVAEALGTGVDELVTLTPQA